MQQWADVQARFARALLDPALDAPPEIGGDGSGFAVYRNNVMSSLLDALQERFPVTHTLVGTEFFRAMAREFVREQPPASPLLFSYGDDLPAFIAAFEPAGGVPYLADVARLEIAWSDAYHAADAAALDASALRAAEPSSLAASTLSLHPSLRLVRSQYPVATLWAVHRSGESSGVDLTIAEDVLIVRPEAEVSMHRLPRAAFAFVHALLCGRSIEQAANAALGVASDFDAGAHLLSLFSIGAVVALTPATEESP